MKKIKIERKVNKIERLMSNGQREIVDFIFDGEKYTLKTNAIVSDPVILIVN